MQPHFKLNIRLTAILFVLSSISLSTFGQLKSKGTIAQSKNVTIPAHVTNPNGVITLQWEKPRTEDFQDKGSIKYLSFKGAVLDAGNNNLPQYFRLLKLKNGTTQVKVTLLNPVYVTLSAEEIQALTNTHSITADIKVSYPIVIRRKEPYVSLTIIPLRKNPATGQYEKLVSFSLDIKQSSEAGHGKTNHTPSFATSSVLSTGRWYKIGVTKDGIYKLDYNFFKNIGFDMSTAPANIRIYGNGGAMSPILNKTPRPDDLLENAIFVNGQADPTFGVNDYVLFYGQSPNTWTYSSSGPCGGRYHHTVNLYTDTTYYFITADLGPGKRITAEATSLATPKDTVTTFDDYAYHEMDAINLIQSGNEWFGEYFDITTSYNIAFNFPNLSLSSPVYINAAIASRYDVGFGSYSQYTIASNSVSKTINVPTVSTGIFYAKYADMGTGCYTFTPTSNTVVVNVTKATAGAIGWLYYVEANVRDQLSLTTPQMEFRDMNSVGAGNVSLYKVSCNQPMQIWDVTHPNNVQSVADTVPSFGVNEFALPSDSLKQFVAFTGSSFNTATYMGAVANQNLHGMGQADLLIVTDPEFLPQAQQLGAFHYTHDSLKTQIVTTTEVFNEFSSGRQDPTAIRDFARMFYSRATSYSTLPKYLLLFGDASYDPKHRISGNTNHLIVYESNESFDPTQSYVTDDYYAVLDSNEGDLDAGGYSLDIGVGRIPADDPAQAQTVVNKIISYETGAGEPVLPSTSCCAPQAQYNLGSWRNSVCFIAHDGDNDLHIGEAENLADYVDSNYHNLNVNKIYLDAYQMVQTPGGPRYPDVNVAIDNQMNQGLLIINFTGHGGQLGLATTRVLTFSDIYSWTNINRLSLFFTASCEFARFDDPLQVSAGELCLLSSTGGNIALMTTVRDVFSGGNQTLNQYFFDSLYHRLPDGTLPRFGDLFTISKNSTGPIVNCRMFALLGDPAVRLAYPQYRVYTTAINAVPVNSKADTLKAFEKVTISGYVGDTSGNLLNGFNGVLYPTVYDKPTSVTTLDNLGGSNSPALTFNLQKNSLFKGRASINNGKFSFTFIVPKDISYNPGFGKISYYAQDPYTEMDATGNYENIIVGGSLTSISNNGKGPQVRLYMNDSTFVFGGLTDESPQIFAIVNDSNGINTTGNSIGHDITAVVDNNTQNTIDLNDYFHPALNSYQKGTISYPLSSLSPGKHTLSLRVWNVFNNTTQAYTEFNVEPKSSLELQHVLNYPNPFTTHTQFYFEINDVCDLMDVQIQIFTVSGKLVRNIVTSVKLGSFRSQPVDWDGRDDYGDKLANGVYIYHVKVRTSTGSTADTYQKLVIL
jgi:hypothetical protein